MPKSRLSPTPSTSPLRKVAAPLLATALATTAAGCDFTRDVGIEQLPESDAGSDDAGTAEPEDVGEIVADPEFVGEPPESPTDGGEPGVDG